MDEKEADSKPLNAVLFVVDDMGWKDVGAYGSDFYQTPNIDRLAADGILFDNAYSSCTVCSPSRASIMTGKYPATLNLTDWIEGWKYPKAKLSIPDWTKHLDLSETTLAEVLQNAGYKTAHLGKWHLGEDEKYWPKNQGFDVNYGGWSKGRPNRDKKIGAKGYFAPYGNPRLSDPKGEEYLTERLATEASQFIEEEKDNPFFLNFWFYNVHTPLQARKEKIEKYETLIDPDKNQKNPIYAAMVEHVDEAVGQVVQKLKEKNLYDNTIIIFTSDNGGLIGNANKKVTDNFPLREGKGGIYEGGVRVPLIIKMPDNQSAGRQRSTPVTSIDYMPTLIDFLDLEVPKGLQAEMDGISLLPILENIDDTLERGSIYWHYPHYHRQGATPYSAVRNGEWKLIHVLESDTYELYNLKEDIGEQNDLSKKYPEIEERLKKDLNNWRKKVGAQMPAPNPNYNPPTGN
jgi:arylsulfatase A-like enzyme